MTLWRKVKPPDKPDDGVPFDTDDTMFNPPAVDNGRGSYYESASPTTAPHDSKPANIKLNTYYEPPPNVNIGQKQEKDWSGGSGEAAGKDPEQPLDRDKDRDCGRRKGLLRNNLTSILPLEQDIRRLFQDCKIGVGNASLLSQALVHAKVEELKKGEGGEIIKVCYGAILDGA